MRHIPFFIALFCATANAETTVVYDDFESGVLSTNGGVFGAQSGGSVSVSTNISDNFGGSIGSLKASYPTATGAVYAWGVYDISEISTNDVYIEFWAKMPNAKQGLKFLKIFGGDNGGYANTTFALDYTGSDNGMMYQVSFGDGSSSYNDTGNVINFNGANPSWIGRSYGMATVLTPQNQFWSSVNWGTTWHHFRVHIKYNSGTTAANEVNDGEYYVEIDGEIYVNATGLFNRHYSNPPIDRIELLGWSQSGTQPFDIYYDNVRITTGGFVQESAVSSPLFLPYRRP